MTERALALVALLGASSAAWWAVRAWTGRLRPVRGRVADGSLTAADLGQDLGAAGTLVQFSAETCATCPQVRRALTRVAAGHEGVRHVEVAVEERGDLVRRFRVLRTPTVLLLGPDGAVRAHASGPLSPTQVEDALRRLTPADRRSIDV